MRIDKWVWAARFFKTRSLAAGEIDRGRVRIGGERIKPARELRVGECVEIERGDERLEVVVRALSDVRGPAPVAQALYAETADSIARRQARREQRQLAPEPAAGLRGRPTKREGRELRRVGEGRDRSGDGG
jgi:ribosome-associated heat shock protein Hsp15